MKILASVVSFLLFPTLIVAGSGNAPVSQQEDNKAVNNEQENGQRRDLGYPSQLPTIERWLKRRGNFSTLYNVLELAGLAPQGPLFTSSSLTLFAPSEAAFVYTFDQYPGLDEILLGDPEGALATVLAYHVLVGESLAGDIPQGTTKLETFGGEWLHIIKTCDDHYKGGYDASCTVHLKDGTDDVATVTNADNQARNGVVHVIDKVLIPPSLASVVEGLIYDYRGPHSDTYYGY